MNTLDIKKSCFIKSCRREEGGGHKCHLVETVLLGVLMSNTIWYRLGEHMGQATWQSVSLSVYVFGKLDKDIVEFVVLLFSYFITLQFYGQYSSTNLFILMSLAQF